MQGDNVGDFDMSNDDTIVMTGNGPRITVGRYKELAGQVCAVKFDSQDLLGHGKTWDEALAMVPDAERAEGHFYRYQIPSKFSVRTGALEPAKPAEPSR